MASSFFGLYIQRDALNLAQKGLDITGHNITNIETAGYSRQRLDICSVANTAGSLGYNTQVGLAGKGADAIGVTQIRDKLLDGKVRKYSSELCDVGAKTTILSDIEDILDDVENDTTGLSAIMGNFKASFQSFSATGTDRRDLANISLNAGQSVLNVLQNFDTRIRDVENSLVKDMDDATTKINSMLREMAALNKQIVDGYVQMNDVNAAEYGYATDPTSDKADALGYIAEHDYGPLELKDKFNSLADELSQFINIEVKEEPQGSYTVSFFDQTILYKDRYARFDVTYDEGRLKDDYGAEKIEQQFSSFNVSNILTDKQWQKARRNTDELDIDKTLSDDDKSELKAMYVKMNKLIDTGNLVEAHEFEEELMAKYPKYSPVFKDHLTSPYPSYALETEDVTEKLKSGDMKGLFDMYNGVGECYMGADGVAYKGVKYYKETIRNLANTIAEGFNSIYTKFNADHASDPGYVPFRMFEFKGVRSVENLQIADVWKNDALRAVHPLGTEDEDFNYDQLDNQWVNQILNEFGKDHTFGREPGEYTFEEFVQFYGNTVGSQLEYELGNHESTSTMLDSVASAREEVMGVSMDEEGVNMMTYQKWYNAISRMITSLDQCLEKLINGTGVCGL